MPSTLGTVKIALVHIDLWHVDTFTERPFAGNPAAVCRLDQWLDGRLLQAVAGENNLPATAFFVQTMDHYELRWFTPRCEIRLCGHATLASAFVLLNILDRSSDSVRFETRLSGPVTVSRDVDHDGLLTMDFPLFNPQPCVAPPATLLKGLGMGTQLADTSEANQTYIVLCESEDVLRQINPDFALLKDLHPYVAAVTAQGKNCDFVSRYFAPSYGVPEDPVTGSAHCALGPYWAERLGKATLHARQLSARGGELWCDVKRDRVTIKGNAVLTLSGSFRL